MRRLLAWAAIAAASLAVLAAVSVFGVSAYYASERGRGCASCHEMRSYVIGAHDSSHRAMRCAECHDASLRTRLRNTWIHVTRTWPETIRLRDMDVLAMTARCRACHQQEYASWHAGPHSATYAQIFSNRAQNSRQLLMDDCLRCHGMYFGGSIRDLVQPQNTTGPWRLVHAHLADQPTMPCQACHSMHRQGAPETGTAGRAWVAGDAVPASLAFYDRRERMHFAASKLPIPQLYDQDRPLHVSQDPRQGICYQCHAPRMLDAGTAAAMHNWGEQAGSGDDRTPMGVHEGLSCFACHNGHSENARASCKNCHPQMSHCGLDVETMDTTFAQAASSHNIHWVKCTDCHQHGIPEAKFTSGIHAPSHSGSGSNG
jgi:hypothetical protein